jgi:hypothetical protein
MQSLLIADATSGRWWKDEASQARFSTSVATERGPLFVRYRSRCDDVVVALDVATGETRSIFPDAGEATSAAEFFSDPMAGRADRDRWRRRAGAVRHRLATSQRSVLLRDRSLELPAMINARVSSAHEPAQSTMQPPAVTASFSRHPLSREPTACCDFFAYASVAARTTFIAE